jgi:hypothetical protein
MRPAEMKWLPIPGLYTSLFVTILLRKISIQADPARARALSARTLDRGFESRLRLARLFSSVDVVLSCVGGGLATSWSLVQGVLPSVDNS